MQVAVVLQENCNGNETVAQRRKKKNFFLTILTKLYKQQKFVCITCMGLGFRSPNPRNFYGESNFLGVLEVVVIVNCDTVVIICKRAVKYCNIISLLTLRVFMLSYVGYIIVL